MNAYGVAMFSQDYKERKKPKKDEKSRIQKAKAKNENNKPQKAKGVPWFHGTNDNG